VLHRAHHVLLVVGDVTGGQRHGIPPAASVPDRVGAGVWQIVAGGLRAGRAGGRDRLSVRAVGDRIAGRRIAEVIDAALDGVARGGAGHAGRPRRRRRAVARAGGGARVLRVIARVAGAGGAGHRDLGAVFGAGGAARRHVLDRHRQVRARRGGGVVAAAGGAGE